MSDLLRQALERMVVALDDPYFDESGDEGRLDTALRVAREALAVEPEYEWRVCGEHPTRGAWQGGVRAGDPTDAYDTRQLRARNKIVWTERRVKAGEWERVS